MHNFLQKNAPTLFLSAATAGHSRPILQHCLLPKAKKKNPQMSRFGTVLLPKRFLNIFLPIRTNQVIVNPGI